MAVTAIGDVFVPQVIGDLATNILFGKLTLLQSGVVDNLGNEIYADGGNTITLPFFDTALGVVQDNPGATRTGVTPSKIHMDTYTESVLSKIVSFDFDKNSLADVSGKVDLNQHVAKIVSRESGKAIQDMLVLRAEETDLVVSRLGESTKTLTVDAIAKAKMARGEYAEDEGAPVLFVHSVQATDLLQSSDFKTLTSAATLAIAAKTGFMPKSAIGTVHGCWVVLMDNIRHQQNIPAISSITRSGTTATVTTASAHGLRAGDYITISGATEAGYNTTATVGTVPSTTTFTYTVAGSPDSPATGTPVFTPNFNSLLIWPSSVGLYIKKEVEGVIKDVHPGTTTITADFDFRYAGTLRREKPRGVVRLVTR